MKRMKRRCRARGAAFVFVLDSLISFSLFFSLSDLSSWVVKGAQWFFLLFAVLSFSVCVCRWWCDASSFYCTCVSLFFRSLYALPVPLSTTCLPFISIQLEHARPEVLGDHANAHGRPVGALYNQSSPSRHAHPLALAGRRRLSRVRRRNWSVTFTAGEEDLGAKRG